MNPMRRLRRRLTAIAVAVVAAAATSMAVPPAAQACCDPPQPPQSPQTSVKGTICWEKGGRRPAATVYLDKAVKWPVTVHLSTVDGSAVAPGDYTAITQLKVTIPAGVRSVEVPLDVKADDVTEPDESFTVVISDPTSGVIGNGKDAVIIRDGGPPPANHRTPR